MSEVGGGGPAAFSGIQILVHWAVVGMVVTQWLTADAIPRTHHTLLPPDPTDLLLHEIHVYCGIGIGLLVGLRVLMRLVLPRPSGDDGPAWSRYAATAVHWGLYASLAGQAATGFVATYFTMAAADLHKLLWNVTLALVAVHVAAAAIHAFRRDGVISRMLPAFARR